MRNGRSLPCCSPTWSASRPWGRKTRPRGRSGGALSPYYGPLCDSELERHGGTVEKFIGDAVVALFGAPVAHEDDPERAVRAAFAIREAIAELNERDPTLELQVRTPSTRGRRSWRSAPARRAGEAMVPGDVVNTAARLQTARPRRRILAGEATYRATSAAIEYAGSARSTRTGSRSRSPAWEAVARARPLGATERRVDAPLVGRARELTVLRDALDGRAQAASRSS